jgi:hypothetical protein
MNLINDDALFTINAVADPATFSEDAMLKIKTITRLKKLLQREKQGYLRVLHARTGVGLSVSDFNTIVRGLVEEQWCVLKEGRQGGVTVVVNEHFTNINVPEAAPSEVEHNA